MKLAIIGYGKMGKAIEQIAKERGHQIELIIDYDNQDDLTIENLQKCDVAIEFTRPESAVENYKKCFEAAIPVVSGTTGWLDHKKEVLKNCENSNGTLFYASNFSVGVNIFFELNKKLADLLSNYQNYHVSLEEIHHLQKLDAPSGTAITLAEDIIDRSKSKNRWVNDQPKPTDKELNIVSKREEEVPGIHKVKYESEIDFIEITHSAKSRKGFALGALLAAEFCLEHSGILTMSDLLEL